MFHDHTYRAESSAPAERIYVRLRVYVRVHTRSPY